MTMTVNSKMITVNEMKHRQEDDGSTSIYFEHTHKNQSLFPEQEEDSVANDVSTVTLDHHDRSNHHDDDDTMELPVSPETSAALRASQRITDTDLRRSTSNTIINQNHRTNHKDNSGSDSSKQRRQSHRKSSALRYQQLDVFARDDEKQALRKCLQRLQLHAQEESTFTADHTTNTMSSSEQERATTATTTTTSTAETKNTKRNQLCLISGVSGCGKSTMAKYVQHIIEQDYPNGLYVEGKFDMNTKGEPLSGIKAACLQICGEMLFLKRSRPQRFHMMLKSMKETIETEIPILLELIPDLQDVLSAADSSSLSSDHSPSNTLDLWKKSTAKKKSLGTDSDSSKIRLYIAFRRFLRFIAKHFTPFVMALDDLHRADTASLEMILSSLTDADNPGYLLVCTHRSNEVHDNTSLQEFISDSKLIVDDPVSGLAKVTELELTNFTLEHVQQIIMILFDMKTNDQDEEDKARRLAQCVYKRTMGNMFYLNVFLALLRDEGLVQYRPSQNKWEWDEAAILASTTATGNVVDMMKSQLQEMPQAIQKRISFAALLGSSFDAETEAIVWANVAPSSSMPSTIPHDRTADEWLPKALESGILEKLDGDSRYQWVHDKVQEAAIALLSYDDRPRYEYMVGRALLDNLPEDKVESRLFTIVDLLNGHVLSRQECNRWESIVLNKRAAQKAFDQCAFSSAHEYTKVAIARLPTDAWRSHHDVTLDLYSLAAEAADSLADLEHLQQYTDIVIKRKDLSIVQKSRVLNAQLNCYYREETPGSIEKGFQLLLFAMTELNMTFPKRQVGKVFSSLSLFLKIKRKIKSLSQADVLAMPLMTDPKKIMLMTALGKNMPHVYLTNPDWVVLWILRFGEFTLDHGICHFSQTAFAQLGIVFLIFGDMELADKCATFATLLVDQSCVSNRPSVAAGYQAFGMTLSYRRPYRELTGPLHDLYIRDVGAGDLMSASSDMFCYLFIHFAAGCHLTKMEDLCRIHEHQVNEWKNENSRLQVAMLWQTVLNLLGARPKDPCKMEGRAIKDYAAMKSSLSIVIQHVILKYLELFLCAIFGEFELAAEIMADDDDDLFHKSGPALSLVMHDAFVRGLCWFGLARKTGHAKYKRAGKKVLAKISKWVKKGNPNVLHYEKLFQAELAALNGKLAEADLYYHKAVGLATESGFIHDAAIINERCGDFFQNIQRKSPGYAIHKIEEACRCYEDWGCSLKAQILRAQYSLNRTTVVSQSTILVKT